MKICNFHSLSVLTLLTKYYNLINNLAYTHLYNKLSKIINIKTEWAWWVNRQTHSYKLLIRKDEQNYKWFKCSNLRHSSHLHI